jgi:hypothetical protein
MTFGILEFSQKMNEQILQGVSSVLFPFQFPAQLHCKLVSSGISSQSVQNIDLVCYLKKDTYTGPISFEV